MAQSCRLRRMVESCDAEPEFARQVDDARHVIGTITVHVNRDLPFENRGQRLLLEVSVRPRTMRVVRASPTRPRFMLRTGIVRLSNRSRYSCASMSFSRTSAIKPCRLLNPPCPTSSFGLSPQAIFRPCGASGTSLPPRSGRQWA